MSFIRLVFASLFYYWRTNLAVAAGVAAGTAVLTGALLVGDSMTGSLRHLALDRLGRVDEVLLTDRFFRRELAEELAAEAEFGDRFREAVPAIFLRTSLETAEVKAGDSETPRRANRVDLIGCDDRFWQLGVGGPAEPPKSRQIVINRALAEQLGIAAPGTEVMVRLPRVSSIPADSPLGRKSETVRGARLTVSAIIPAENLGAFGLRPSQQLPRNAYVPLEWLQARLDRKDRVNAILVAGSAEGADPSDDSHHRLQRMLKPRLDDYGIRLQKTERGYLDVTSDRMILDAGTEAALLDSLEDQRMKSTRVQPALTYLANSIASGDREIPYSTITAIDFSSPPPLGPLLASDGKPIGPLAHDQIVLNAWAAEDLQVSVGDLVRVTYFEPESTEGKVQEQTAEFRLAAVARLTGAAADPALTPEVPGVTDQRSIADWNPPFPFDAKRIRKKDEQYWDEHRATPKAFVSLSAGRKLWASRFGQTTSLRIVPDEETTLKSLEEKLDLDPAALGFVFQPVKRQALTASAGTTPFNILFLSFSFFVIAAAVMLVALLFRLGIDQRATQIGTLLALGIGRRGTTRLLVAEGLFIAGLASLLGVVLGIAYAALMLTGLRTWWLGAVVTPFLRLHVSCLTLVVGYASGLVLAVATIVWSVWRTRRLEVRQLLAGQPFAQSPLAAGSGRRAGWVVWALVAGAIILGLGASTMGEEARAGAFFGAGAMVLTASLLWIRKRLKIGATGPAVALGRGNLPRMAARNAARNPGRSTLSIGLVGATAFLIIAISAFHLDPSGRIPELSSGDGGFALVAQSDQPVYYDLDTPDGRIDLGFPSDDSDRLRQATLHSVRVKPGDDASCLNLYQPRQPRILGLPDSVIDRGGFAWAKTAAADSLERENPWRLLNKKLPPDEDGIARVPVVIDMATAMYSLHLYRGVGETYDVTDRSGRTVRLEVVGLLKNSIFQGDLLIGEAALLDHFPEVGGYRFFLVEAGGDETRAVAGALEGTLGDWGLVAETTGRRLARFLAVQNTYLSTFQSLGALGLLLGTFGLAAVQLRAVLERRGELALMRATGFRRRSLAWLVMIENGFLLLAGLACGVLAALVAVLPHLVSGSATIPWSSLVGTLAVILVVGLLAGLAAVRAVLRAPLVAALRGE